MTYHFLFVFHSNCGHMLYCFGDKVRYWSKMEILHTIFYITTLWGNGCKYFVLFFHNRADIPVTRFCKKSTV